MANPTCSEIIKKIGEIDEKERKKIFKNKPEMPRRAWLLYLEARNPTTIRDISKRLGYKGTALYLPVGKEKGSLLDWMTKKDFISIVGKKRREFVFKSNLYEVV